MYINNLKKLTKKMPRHHVEAISLFLNVLAVSIM